MKFRRTLSVLLAIFALTVFSCENWMKDDNLYSDIERDVKVANATKINVFVRFAATAQGITSPNGSTTFKVGIPQEITATTETEYGFIRWAAFSTNDYPTGLQHRTLIFIDEDDYETNLSPKEIKSPTVVFSNAKNPNTTVTINSTRNDIFLVPLVTARPEMGLSIPSNGEKEVTRNMSIRISFSKPMDPLSFADAVSITEGSLTLIGGEVEISSKNISNLFEPPTLSKSGKTLTLKFTPEGQKIGYDPKTTVNVIVSKQVKDTFGFSMVQDGSLSFTAGSTMDTWAPRITQLTGGKNLDFAKFQGMYKLAETQQTLKTLNLTNIIITKGSDDAPIDSASDNFYTQPLNGSQKIIANRVKDKVTLRVFAEDLTQTNDGHVENDVDLIAIRSKTIFNNYASYVTPSDTYNTTSLSYVPRGYVTRDGADDTKNYEALVNALNENNVFGANGNAVGCILVYDLIDEEGKHLVPDGIVQIDVAAIDNVGNDGFNEAADVSKVQGNGYASIFVVKDTTPPAGLSDGGINISVDGNSFAEDNYYNRETFEMFKVSLTDSARSSISDQGDANLCSKKSDIKWTIIQIEDDVTSENLLEQFTGENVVWKELNGTIQNTSGSPDNKVFIAPDEDKKDGIRFAYAIKDDMDNINATIFRTKALYDCTAPEIGELSWIADSGSAAGLASGEEINNQTLVIPVTDETSKLKSLEILVKPVDEHGIEGEAYATPFAGSALAIYKNDTTTQLETSDYTRNGNKVTLNGTYNGIEKILIKGLKIADNLAEGKYNVYVKAYDAAGNVKTSAPIALSNDSTLPVIEKIYIPDIKKFVRVADSSNTPEYWIDAHCGNLKLVNAFPVAKKVFITFKENNSGAQIFNFADSSMKLTTSSKVYKVDSNLQIDGDELSCSFDLTNNKFTLDNPLLSQGDSFITIAITDVQLGDTYSALKLVITDKATNQSIAKDTITSDSVSNIVSFRHEAIYPAISGFNLEDQEAEGNTAQTPVPAAIDGFTNSTSVKATVTVTPRASGFSELTIINKAKFDDTTVIKDITSSPAISIAYDIVPGTDNKTIRFKKTVGSEDVAAIVGVSSGDNRILEITNLKLIPDDLNNPDGIYVISIKGQSAAEVQATFKTDTITLDTIPPEWGSTKGLYTAEYPNKVTPANVYPHPKADKSSEGITFPGSDDLYFYRSSYIRIDPKVVDSNPRLDGDNLPIVRWTGPGITNYSDYSYFYGRYTGDFTVTIYDKAGNASPVRTFHVINVTNLVTTDDSRKDIKTNLENEVELLVPEGADLQKNTFLNGVRSPEGPRNSSSFDYYNGSQNSKIYVFNYILKQFDGKNYQLKVPVHNYAAGGEKTVPIEQYGVSHQYTEFPSNNTDCAEDPFTPREPNWHDYKANTSPVTDGHLSSRVDENGDIIITLPNDHNCPPVSLWLKDACGNTEYILLNPGLKDKLGTLTVCETRPGTTKQGKRNQAVAYVIDNRVGDNDSHNGTGSNEEKIYPTNTLVSKSDISFYKKNSSNELPGLKLKELSDSCRFPYVSNYNGLADLANNPSDYSLKSKIIVWQGDGKPAYEKFYDSSISGSVWYAWKEFFDEVGSTSSAFSLENNFPEFDTTAHDTNKYELWYIIEDRVGNYEVRQLKYGSETDWLYDVTPPKLDVKQATNVNNIDGKNYYSNSSSVKYSIEDKQSGIQHNGSTSYNYSNFASRVQLYPENGLTDYPLSGKTPDSNGKISIEDVKDWAENIATSVGLENGGSNIWVKQTSAPSFSTTPLDIVAPNHGTHRFNVSSQNGIYTIDASYNITKIELKFYINDTEKLLGWVIKDNDTAPDSSKFYTINDVEQIPYSNTTYTYTFNKTNNGQPDTSTIWSDFVHDKDMYFYPVNRAGMINTTPVIIHFKKNVVPALNGSLSYSDIVKYPASGTATTNYTNSDSKVKFKTKNDPTKCRIIYGTGSSDYIEFTLSEYVVNVNETTQQYEIPLGTAAALKNIENATLKLVLVGSEYSGEIDLKGPANVNSWTFDETAPAISIASIKSDDTTSSVLYNGVEYLLGDNAIITFSTSATDIAKYEWKVGNADWATIPAANLSGNICTFSAPANETTYKFRATDKAGNISNTIEKKLKKDAANPTGNLSYTMKHGDDTAQTGFTNEQNDPNDSSKRLVTYAPGLVNAIYFDFSGITDAGSGIKRFNVKTGTSNNYITDATSYTLTLDENWTGQVYEIIAEDNVGHTRILNTLTFTADNNAPDISIASVESQGQSTVYDAAHIGDTWYLNRNKAKLTFASSATDIDHYEWDEGNGNVEANYKTIALTEGSYTISSVQETAKTYYFRAVDKVGNKGTAVSVKIVYDSASPYVEDGKPVTYIPMLGNSQATAGFTASGTGTITFTYNSDYVNKLIFDFSGVKDACSGIKKIVYKVNNEENTITLDSNYKGTISLAGPLNATYDLIAYDNVDRTTTLGTYIFTPDSTPPSVKENNGSGTTYWVSEDDVKKLQKYSIVGSTSLITVKDSQIGENYISNCYKGSLQISYPKSVISGAVKYKYIITEPQTSTSNLGYVTTKPAANASGWEDLTVSGENYVFTIPEVTTPHKHIGIFFKDAVENVSEVYYFGNKDDYRYQWWLVEKDITADDISITPSADYAQGTTSYTLTVTLPEGTILRKIETTVGNVDSVAFSSYTQGNFSWNGSDPGASTGYVYIPTMTVTLSNVNSSDATLKINGVGKTIFAAPGNGTTGNSNLNANLNMAMGAFSGVNPVVDRMRATIANPVIVSPSVNYRLNPSTSARGVSSSTISALSGVTASVNTKARTVKESKKSAKSLEKKLAEVEKTSPVQVIEKEIIAEQNSLAGITESVSESLQSSAFVTTPVTAKPVSEVKTSSSDPLVEVAAPVLKTSEVLETPEVSETVTAGIPSKVVIWLVLCTLCAAAAGLVVCLKKKKC